MGRTSIELDDQLVKAGLKMTGCKTKKELVHLALKELVAKKGRKKLFEFEEKVAWEGDLRALRKRRT